MGGGVVGVAEERKCKMCVCVTGGTKGISPTELCYTHTHYTFSFSGHTKSTQKYNIDKPKNLLNNSFLFYSLAPMFEVLLVFKAQLISRPLSATQCCHTAGLMTLPDVTLAPGATHCDTHCPTHI